MMCSALDKCCWNADHMCINQCCMLTMPACVHYAGVHTLQSLATVNRIGRTHINNIY